VIVVIHESQILQELDEDIRELLTLTHEIKIDIMLDNYPDEKIKRALSLADNICSNFKKVRKWKTRKP
jgi:predicted RNA-binding protein with RPS1 domain